MLSLSISYNKDCEDERSFPGDLPRGRQNLRSILEFEGFHSIIGYFRREDSLSATLEAYFYFNKVSYLRKVRLVLNKLYCGARE